MASPGFTSIWTYDVRHERETEFLGNYAPDGAWARLFGRAPGYLGTELLHDPNRAQRYSTIDRWVSAAAYESFRAEFDEEYEALDQACAELTLEETPVGVFAPAPGAGFQVSATVPILRIFSVEKAREFYVDFLGFAVDWEHRFDANAPLYMQVSRAGLALHLSEHHGDSTPGTCIYVSVRGLEAFHREITAKNYPFLRPGIESTFYGSRCLEVIDPFGNRIRFDEVNA